MWRRSISLLRVDVARKRSSLPFASLAPFRRRRPWCGLSPVVDVDVARKRTDGRASGAVGRGGCGLTVLPSNSLEPVPECQVSINFRVSSVQRWRGDAGSLRTVTYDLASVPCLMLRDEVAEADEGRGNETRAGRDLDQD